MQSQSAGGQKRVEAEVKSENSSMKERNGTWKELRETEQKQFKANRQQYYKKVLYGVLMDIYYLNNFLQIRKNGLE